MRLNELLNPSCESTTSPYSLPSFKDIDYRPVQRPEQHFIQRPASTPPFLQRPVSTPPLMQKSLYSFQRYNRSNSLFDNSYPSPESIQEPSPAAFQMTNSPQPEKKKFACPEEGCHKSFTRRYNLSAHLRCHRLERPYECTQCTQAFARKHDLQRHIRSLHDQNKIYGPCPYCTLYFTRSDALQRHMKREERRDGVSGIVCEVTVGCKNC
jgi:uncharacterized Zn-finger protein